MFDYSCYVYIWYRIMRNDEACVSDLPQQSAKICLLNDRKLMQMQIGVLTSTYTLHTSQVTFRKSASTVSQLCESATEDTSCWNAPTLKTIGKDI